MKSIFPFIHPIPSVWCFDRGRGQGGGVGLFMYVLMFNCRLRCLPPSLFFPSSPLRLPQPNLRQTAVINQWWSQSPINATAEWPEKACRPPAALITPCLGIKPALLCYITCDGGISALTESAGNGMTSPGFFSVLRGHQSSAQGHSDTKCMALTSRKWYLLLHKVLHTLVLPSIIVTITIIMVSVR